MNRVYVISRYRATKRRQRKFNLSVAKYFCKKIIDEGNVPVAPHIYYTQFLDDNHLEDRAKGCELGIWELQNSQEFLLVVIDGVISEGMRNELKEVARLGMKGRFIYMTHDKISKAMKVAR